MDTTVDYAGDSASLGWLLELVADEETMEVTLVLRGAGEMRYRGQGTVTVRDGSIGSVVVTPVAVEYVGPAVIATVTVTPRTAHLAAPDETVTLTAEARDRHGVAVDATFAWESADPAVVTVQDGVVTAVGAGSTVVRVETAGVRDSASIEVAAPPGPERIAAIEVSPGQATLSAPGATRQFVAVARTATGLVVPGATFQWTVANTAVATIDAVTGLATATGQGSTVVSATANGASGTAVLSVELTQLVASVVVLPGTAQLTALGATQAFTAEARDGAGNLVPGIAFSWSSSAPAVATIDAATGVATATGHGSTTISATANGVVGTATLAVELTARVASVVVTPGTAQLTALGATKAFTAEARDGAGNLVPGIAFSWTSSVPEVATVDVATGLATAMGHGLTTITAHVSGVSGTAVLSVELAQQVASVVVTPSTAQLTALGATQAFAAEARDAGGTVLPGVPIAWSSAAPAVATIDAATGVATAAGHGTSTISATVNGVTGAATLTVELMQSVASVIVTPSTAQLTALGATQAFTAEARDGEGNLVPGIAFSWTSSAPEVATVDAATGVATATGHGSTTISAIANGVVGTATLTVELTAHVASVVVTPGTAQLVALGATQVFTAEARDASGAVLPGLTFVWASLDGDVATIDQADGLATAVGNGTTSIVASVAGVSGTTTLVVQQVTATVRVEPAAVTITSSQPHAQLVARAYDANGREVIGVAFTWSTSDPATVSVDATGRVTKVNYGVATIAATASGARGESVVTVVP